MFAKRATTPDLIEAVAAEARDIASISADYRRAVGLRRQSLLNTITGKVDDLLGTLLMAFRGSISAEEASAVLGEHHPLTESCLAQLPPASVPLVVLRELIAVHQTPIRTKSLSNWPVFAECYRHAVV